MKIRQKKNKAGAIVLSIQDNSSVAPLLGPSLLYKELLDV
jgi:hypothetical protein